jgi:hypothetical protein
MSRIVSVRVARSISQHMTQLAENAVSCRALQCRLRYQTESHNLRFSNDIPIFSQGNNRPNIRLEVQQLSNGSDTHPFGASPLSCKGTALPKDIRVLQTHNTQSSMSTII